MLDFFSACAGLFSKTFNAACGLEIFEFLAALLMFEACFGLFLLLHRGTKKL